MLKFKEDELGGRKVYVVRENGEVRFAGIFRGNRLICFVNKEHFVKIVRGFAKSKEVLEYARTIGIDKVIFIYEKIDKTNEIYYSNLNEWFIYGEKKQLGGFEPQIFLPIKYMKKEG